MIIKALLDIIAGPFIDKIAGIAQGYFNKQISEAEFKAEVQKATLDTFSQVETAWAEASTKQYESFQQTARSNSTVARAYVVVIVTQLFVLVWYQWGASAFELLTGTPWPKADATVDWAYAILALCLGGGAFVMRGPSVPIAKKE